MQAFHKNLISNSTTKDGYQIALNLLRQANLPQMRALEGAPSWESWQT